MSEPGDLLNARQSQYRTALAVSAYAALKKLGKVRDHRILVYRCPGRCLLADVLQLPQGFVVHTPGYKLSPTVNETASSESGRAKNTLDGVRRWKAHTFFTDDCLNVSLNCDHVRQQVLELTEMEAHRAAGHVEVTVYPSGERRPR